MRISLEKNEEMLLLGRIQFYPSQELEKCLKDQATQMGIGVPVLVNYLLNKHYRLIPSGDVSSIELREKIYEDVKKYLRENKDNDKMIFSLADVSENYRNIDMTTYAGKPSALRASIGKEFNNKYVGKIAPFTNIEQVMKNGKPVRSTSNRAAMYRWKGKDTTNEKLN